MLKANLAEIIPNMYILSLFQSIPGVINAETLHSITAYNASLQYTLYCLSESLSFTYVSNILKKNSMRKINVNVLCVKCIILKALNSNQEGFSF